MKKIGRTSLGCIIFILRASFTNGLLSPISVTTNQHLSRVPPTNQNLPFHESQYHRPISKESPPTQLTLVPPGTLTCSGGAIVASSVVALPSLKKIFATCLFPTLIGLWKYEYGVSYAYGTSTAASSYLILKSMLEASAPASPFATMVKIHASAMIFYGVRLNIFLLYRELFLERFRRMRERIEERQTNKEDGAGVLGRIINRVPFILSCAVLYMGLVSPPLACGMLLNMSQGVPCKVALLTYQILVGMTWLGFIIAALGDFTKTMIKGIKGPDHLVTEGIFHWFRHPNYTGEVIGWTANFLASIVAVFVSGCGIINALKNGLITPLLLGSFGLVGIIFVLTAATTNLEKRQKEKYGEKDAYQKWKAWAGFQLPAKKKS